MDTVGWGEKEKGEKKTKRREGRSKDGGNESRYLRVVAGGVAGGRVYVA